MTECTIDNGTNTPRTDRGCCSYTRSVPVSEPDKTSDGVGFGGPVAVSQPWVTYKQLTYVLSYPSVASRLRRPYRRTVGGRKEGVCKWVVDGPQAVMTNDPILTLVSV